MWFDFVIILNFIIGKMIIFCQIALLQQYSSDFKALLAHFKDLDEGVLVAPVESRYTQVGFNIVSVQVCIATSGSASSSTAKRNAMQFGSGEGVGMQSFDEFFAL